MGVPMSQKTKRRRAARGVPQIEFRSLIIEPKTINTDERSVEGVIASEQAVREFDYERGEMVPRTLAMSGAEFNRQMPLLDSHNRYSVRDQLGSIRDIRVEGDKLIGRMVFSSTAEDEWTKVREGHITDISVGFQVLKQAYVPDKTTQKIGDRSFSGPVNVATKWRAFEGSITPIGADDKAKLRGFDPNGVPQQDETEFAMGPKMRALCIAGGMPNDYDDARAAEWLEENTNDDGTIGKREIHHTLPKSIDSDEVVRKLDELARKREAEAAARRVAFRAEVDASCELAGMSEEATRLYDCVDIAEVRNKIKDLKAARDKAAGPSLGFKPNVTAEGRDQFRKDLVTSFLTRSFDDLGVSERTREDLFPKESRGKLNPQFNRMAISDIGRECLLMDGYRYEDVRSLSKAEIGMLLFGAADNHPIQRSYYRDEGTLHTTGSFAYLTENAMNKNLRAGYTEARSTWRTVMKVGNPVPDFKPKRVYITSAIGNFTAWPDGSEPDKSSFMDSRDSYGVEAYARSLEFSWQTFVNDDMGALTSAPYKLGNAAERTVNAYAWSIVTANATMADGQAFFLATATGNRKKANYISSGLAVTVASLGALEELMRQQVGQNTREGSTGPDILNIEPRYLVVPTAVVRNTALAVVKSVADPASSNAGVHNPYQSRLDVIDEPLLAANSTTAWYLVADPRLQEGIEISFLQGQESPRMWSGMEEKTLTRWWAMSLVFGGKAIDHRGWMKQAGA